MARRGILKRLAFGPLDPAVGTMDAVGNAAALGSGALGGALTTAIGLGPIGAGMGVGMKALHDAGMAPIKGVTGHGGDGREEMRSANNMRNLALMSRAMGGSNGDALGAFKPVGNSVSPNSDPMGSADSAITALRGAMPGNPVGLTSAELTMMANPASQPPTPTPPPAAAPKPPPAAGQAPAPAAPDVGESASAASADSARRAMALRRRTDGRY